MTGLFNKAKKDELSDLPLPPLPNDAKGPEVPSEDFMKVATKQEIPPAPRPSEELSGKVDVSMPDTLNSEVISATSAGEPVVPNVSLENGSGITQNVSGEASSGDKLDSLLESKFPAIKNEKVIKESVSIDADDKRVVEEAEQILHASNLESNIGTVNNGINDSSNIKITSDKYIPKNIPGVGETDPLSNKISKKTGSAVDSANLAQLSPSQSAQPIPVQSLHIPTTDASQQYAGVMHGAATNSTTNSTNAARANTVNTATNNAVSANTLTKQTLKPVSAQHNDQHDDEDLLKDIVIDAPDFAKETDVSELYDSDLEVLSSEIDRREKRINEKIEKLMQLRKELKSEDKRIDTKIKQLKKASEDHDRRKDAMKKEQTKLRELKKELESEKRKRATDILKHERKVASMHEKLEILKHQYAEEKARYKELEHMINIKEKSVVEKINELEKKEAHIEAELHKLDIKKQEYEADVKDLRKRDEKLKIREETRKEKLDLVKQKLDEKEKELKKYSRELDARKKDLDKKESKINAAKELKANINRLKETKKKLSAKVKELDKRFGAETTIDELKQEIRSLTGINRRLENKKKKLEAEVYKKMSRIGDVNEALEMEKHFDDRKEYLSKRTKSLSEIRKKLEDDKAVLEKEKIRSFENNDIDEYHPDVEVTREIDEFDKDGIIVDRELYELIKASRNAYKQKDIVKLKELFKKIRVCYEHLEASPEQKRRIYYLIMELKSDIELLVLNSK